MADVQAKRDAAIAAKEEERRYAVSSWLGAIYCIAKRRASVPCTLQEEE